MTGCQSSLRARAIAKTSIKTTILPKIFPANYRADS